MNSNHFLLPMAYAGRSVSRATNALKLKLAKRKAEAAATSHPQAVYERPRDWKKTLLKKRFEGRRGGIYRESAMFTSEIALWLIIALGLALGLGTMYSAMHFFL